MKIKSFTFNLFGENTYIIWNEHSLHAAIIDPGCHNGYEKKQLAEFVSSENLNVMHLLNTHMHIDHAAGNAFVEGTYNVKTSCNYEDSYLANAMTKQAEMFGFPYLDGNVKIAHNLCDGQSITVADSECQILHIPGHTKGHLAFYFPESNIVFSGDALFRMSIGRTDLPGGNYKQLIDSIETKLLTLPRQTLVLPGHGGSTNIGDEQTYNPFL